MSNVSAVKNTKRTVDLGDGVEREVILSLNAMADLEEKYGSIEAAFAKVQEGSVAAIRYLLWCILVPDGDEDLTEKEVGKLIRIDNLSEIMGNLMDVLEEQMPDGSTGPNQAAPTNIVQLPNSDW
nr:MAG TPA: tail assembly chaperone protein [Caudoviricetes sp.]